MGSMRIVLFSRRSADGIGNRRCAADSCRSCDFRVGERSPSRASSARVPAWLHRCVARHSGTDDQRPMALVTQQVTADIRSGKQPVLTRVGVDLEIGLEAKLGHAIHFLPAYGLDAAVQLL